MFSESNGGGGGNGAPADSEGAARGGAAGARTGGPGGSGGFGAGGGGGGDSRRHGGIGGFGGGGGGDVSGTGTHGGSGGFAAGAGGATKSGAGGGGGGAGLGGAIFLYGGSLSIQNSTIEGNTAKGGMGGSGSGHTSHVGGSEGNGYGGGIFSLNGSLTLLNDTISGNLARTAYGSNNNGAGVYVLADQATGIAGGGATYTINNTIIGQASPTGDDLEVSVNGGASVSASGSDNIITTTSGSPTFSLTNTINVNPQLGSLGDNGGLSETMAITPGSPAAGAGDPSQDSGLPYDQRGPGYTRIVNGQVDIGAYEIPSQVVSVTDAGGTYDGSPFAVTDASVTFDGTTIASFGDSSLSYTYYVGDGTSGTDLGSSAPTDAGTYSVVAHFAGYGQYPAADSAAAPFTISPAPLTVTGITAAGKVFDGTTDTTIDTSGATLTGTIYDMDDVALDDSAAVGAFESPDAGIGVTVNVTGLTLTGAQAGDYSLTATTTTAGITPASLSVAGITAAGKVYDGTTDATLDTDSAALSGTVYPDDQVRARHRRSRRYLRVAGRGLGPHRHHHGADPHRRPGRRL